jgi:hypothetical protein
VRPGHCSPSARDAAEVIGWHILARLSPAFFARIPLRHDGRGFARHLTMTCARLEPQRMRRSSRVVNAAGRARFLVTVLAVCSLFALGCQGNVAENGPADASSGADRSMGTTADGSTDGPSLDGSVHVAVDAYSGPCMISASSYDQSCTIDTDCTTVTSRDYCSAGCLCGGSAINVGALAQFNGDISKTPLGSGALGGTACPCVQSFGPCCRSGRCTATCFSPPDALPACADAGGTCLLSAGTTCGKMGPPDACAYSDEVCCLP